MSVPINGVFRLYSNDYPLCEILAGHTLNALQCQFSQFKARFTILRCKFCLSVHIFCEVAGLLAILYLKHAPNAPHFSSAVSSLVIVLVLFC